jgi:hypothetical protein
VPPLDVGVRGHSGTLAQPRVIRFGQTTVATYR